MQDDNAPVERRQWTDTMKNAFGVLIGFITTKFIAIVISTSFAALGAPYVLILAYALHAGLPAFEVFDALGAHMTGFSVISVIATTVILGSIVLPGLILYYDKWPTKYDNMVDGDLPIQYIVISRFRCCAALAPGLALWSLLLLLGGTLTHDPLKRPSLWLTISINLALEILLLFSLLLPLFKRFTPQRGDMSEIMRKPYWALICTNFISISFLLMFARVVETALPPGIFAAEQLRTLISIIMAMFLLFFVAIWPYNLEFQNVQGRTQKVWSLRSIRSTVFPLLVFLFMLYQYPGFFAFLRYYLQVTRLGGGTSAVLTVDTDVAKAWPELFANSGGPEERDNNPPVRSGTVKILLLGRDKIFIEPATSDKAAVGGPLMINRSRVREIMFLPREHNTRVPADSPSK